MRLSLIGAALLATAINPALADEGMWQPHQLPQLESVLKAKGLEIDPKSISKLTEFPMNAVISLGGCTASFVSPKGLVVTNHHCAYGSIQYNSTPENNILQNGFLAKTYGEELPASPGSRVYVTEEVTNVTAKVNAQLNESMDGNERYKAIEQAQKALVAECEQGGGYRCNVYSFHGGLEYYLIKSLEIQDVRLVYNPAQGIGKYGGDIDNWMWPRHTGDYSFYRAYVGKDGKPAPFSEDNVPFSSDSFLKVSAKGVKEGDFVMVTGYPGRTNRYRTNAEVEHQFTEVYPKAKAYREQSMDIIKATAAEGSKARIAYESTLAGLANYAKNYGGMVNSYQKTDMQARKDNLATDLSAWINADKARKKQYAHVLKELDSLIAKSHATSELDLILGYMGRSAMMSTATRLYRLANEQQLPDAQREPGYQERDMTRFKAGMTSLSRRYDDAVDKALFAHFVDLYAQLEPKARISSLDKALGLDKGYDQDAMLTRLAKMYEQTALNEEQVRLEWMDKSVANFKQSDDPFIALAVATYDDFQAREQEKKMLSGELNRVRPQYMAAIIAYNQEQGLPVYADANSTLRVTYGTVKGYSPRDALTYTPFTRLEGITEKYTGIAPFDAPQAQMQQIAAKNYGEYEMASLGSVPVNFLSTVDTTGGNSGSPTLNGNAELVGLLFDGVSESIIGDWDYDANLNRSIHVDSRYMLWVMRHVDKADNLLEEMVIVK
ncbi:S46 family peptidase [Pseudoalteromonas sp. BDTF-M6]|uniref:S46 family peptidase n=1 Tax=Pseudoalteromonas sp. BDTF-M6 TaxID=2796132 RepID=UPI001BAEF90C|nr:S46 family peptidase [Pseudoalteromonas sp. BDTF-M6]MBS3796601.1 S46 family peptidase [Pseudoalteromonas sp. BDTF-M6]